MLALPLLTTPNCSSHVLSPQRILYAPRKKMHTCEGAGLTSLWQATPGHKILWGMFQENVQSIFSHGIMGEGERNSPSKVQHIVLYKCT